MKNSPHIKQIHPDLACIIWQLEFSLNYRFLEMPDIEKDIVPIDLQINTLVDSLNLSEPYNKISTANKQTDINLEMLIEELINEELEAIKAENK
ncbi:hypothetical protein [Klebsiella pneumoniae]|uniref:hypothetical protein n=1 Tax=Klebsiella pneumoniae TaxID=573 RepID=UPI001F5C0414|nr:hypothetical protein [Klebsiella pneumoniae]